MLPEGATGQIQPNGIVVVKTFHLLDIDFFYGDERNCYRKLLRPPTLRIAYIQLACSDKAKQPTNVSIHLAKNLWESLSSLRPQSLAPTLYLPMPL